MNTNISTDDLPNLDQDLNTGLSVKMQLMHLRKHERNITHRESKFQLHVRDEGSESNKCLKWKIRRGQHVDVASKYL